ncbi:MAG: ChaN family lipoprotein [Alphaproteobacteria bacterium]|jgi:uncharacterized iron-regulated protein|nr:ChaN family lipoprotein [Alphaproteobacteria bacterium]
MVASLVSRIILIGAVLLSVAPAWGEIAARPGLIWDVQTRAPITRETLDARIAAARFILLGEKHDNADHHRLQGDVLKSLISAGRRPALAWEMLPRSRQSRIDTFLATGEEDPTAFGLAVGWKDLGWGDWSLFQPIAEAALAGHLPQRAAGLDRDNLKAVGQAGLDALPSDLSARRPKGPALTPDQEKIIEDAVFDGHCGYVPRAHLGPMIQVQVARDLAMADALARSAKPDGAVLITGSQHVRRDAGVPVHLTRMVPGASILTIRFVETERDAETSEPQDDEALAGTGAHDILWFTEPGPDKDYCADLAKRFGLKGKPAQGK